MNATAGSGERAVARSLDDLLRRQATDRGRSTALVHGDQRVTWSELDATVEAVAGGLGQLGLIGGQRVAIVLANRVEFVAAYLAVLRGGMVAVPVNPTSRPGEIRRVLDDCGARVCFADASTVEAVRESVAVGTSAAEPSTPVVVTVGVEAQPGEIGYDDLPAAGRGRAAVPPPRDAESLAVLLYTSGTSSRPRAAMLSHRALLANVEQSGSTDPPPIRADDVVLGVVPMFHVYGLNAVLGQVLRTGAALVLAPRFDADATLALVEREQVTCVPVAPPVISAWLDLPDAPARLASVRVLLSGAGPLAEDVVRAFESRTGIDVEQGYGLTEAGPVVTSTIGTSPHKPGSAGRAIPGVELRVVDDAGSDVLATDPGEIWVRGDNLFSGYWPDRDAAPDRDGWLRTGDVGFLDDDGDLFLVDRLKELVIVSGFNVYPSEIEEVVAEVQGVRECAVIGEPDPSSGEVVVAYVVPDRTGVDAQGLDRDLLATAVLAHCSDRLARFKVPSRVEIVEALPHSATGKVAKGRLRAQQARHEMGLA